jgi:YVTN family beta-propeller protein
MRNSTWAVVLLATTASALLAQDQPQFAGPTPRGYLLPNGWHLSPVGKHLVTTDLPLNIIPLKDGKRALVATNGFNQHSLYLVDFSGDEPKALTTGECRQSWYGLVTDKAQAKIWWSGGGYGNLHTYDLKGDALERTSPAEPQRNAAPQPKKAAEPNAAGEPKKDAAAADAKEAAQEIVPAAAAKTFQSGLAFDDSKQLLYTLNINLGELVASDLKSGQSKTLAIGGRPYDIILGSTQIFVSDWAGAQVLVIDPADFRVISKIRVGDHPNQMALHADGRLFVACANSNSVSVIDTTRGIVHESIFTALFPKSPEGSTPTALALAPDGKTLFVANADNNCVAVIDVETPRQSAVKGFIPTGWYPTAVSVTPDGKNLLVGVGKGLQSKANPIAADGAVDARGRKFPYIGTVMSGALSVIPIDPEAKFHEKLKDYTAMVYRNCPYSDEQLTTAPHPVKTAIPTKVGDPSPIKYVLYVIKENRTYDQVFGDLAKGPNPKGNGDPSLCMFPRRVSPNHHKLAEEFVLLDNLYCNGQVSRDGHPWSTMAYHTDYIARDWHLTYSRRKGVDDDDEGHLQNAPSGHIWDACNRAGLSYRSYGEYGKRVSDGQGATKMEGRVPSLVGRMNPDFGIAKVKGQRTRDTDNAVVFLKEYDHFVANGTMPRFIIMSLGEDHTSGTTVGAFTPEACVASNDLALGRIVEHISKGPLWKETAIFVIEDDAQNGPDHVDAHRTVGFVISPYTKRRAIDSTHYTTVSMIRTIELILGLSPLSQYDAAARPMFNSFTDQADLATYQHEPAQIDLDAKNTRFAYGADRSNRMDFTEYDKIDDFELNEILWHAVMGPNAPEPPAVRRAIAFRSQPRVENRTNR